MLYIKIILRYFIDNNKINHNNVDSRSEFKMFTLLFCSVFVLETVRFGYS